MSDGVSKRGGARPNAGRKPKPKVEPVGDKSAAARVIAALERASDDPRTWAALPPEIRGWAPLWFAQDLRVRLDTRKYLYDKRDGKAVHTVNHLHDKPLDVNVNISIAEVVRKVRERKEQYERSR